MLNNSSQWPSVNIFDTKQFRQARIEAHNALFWMARGANSFLSAAPNNAHLSLFWHRDSNNFRTRSFDGDLQIGLNFPDLELYFCEGGQKVPHSFWLDDRTPAFAEAWYLVELLHRDRDQSKFSTDLPFSSPNMLMGDTEDHNASAYKPELDALNCCVLKGNEILQSVLHTLAQKPEFAKCRQWITLEPESFSLSLNVSADNEAVKLPSIGVSLGDHLRPAPFFFVKDSEAYGSSKTHLLDYDPQTLLPLKSIVNELTSDVALVKKLVNKFIEANNAK